MLFQPGEDPSRGLLRDYEPSDGAFWSTSSHLARSLGSEVLGLGADDVTPRHILVATLLLFLWSAVAD